MNKELDELFRGGVHRNHSQVLIRSSHNFKLCELRSTSLEFTEILTITIYGDSDWISLAKNIETMFRFPSSVDHSFAALKDWISDLSWLDGGHYLMGLDMSNIDTESKDIWRAIDAVIAGVMEHNKEPRVKITLILLI